MGLVKMHRLQDLARYVAHFCSCAGCLHNEYGRGSARLVGRIQRAVRGAAGLRALTGGFRHSYAWCLLCGNAHATVSPVQPSQSSNSGWLGRWCPADDDEIDVCGGPGASRSVYGSQARITVSAKPQLRVPPPPVDRPLAPASSAAVNSPVRWCGQTRH